MYFKKIYLPSYLLLFYVVDYVFPQVFDYVMKLLFDANSYHGLVKSILIALLPLALYESRIFTNQCKYVERTLLPFFIAFLYAQLMYFSSDAPIKVISNIAIYFFLSKYANGYIGNHFCWCIKMITFFACMPVVFYCVVNHSLYYYRDSIFIEKQTMSVLLMLSYVFCLLDVFFSQKKRMINFGLFLFFIGINLFVIQSKSSLFALAVSAIVLYFMKDSVRRWIKKRIGYLLGGYVIVMLLFPSVALPDDIRFGVNRITGTEIFSTNYTRRESRMELTYTIRDEVRALCFKAFRQNPILGIGIGNFATYNKYSNSKISFLCEPESAWLSIITEGGALYGLCMVLFFALNIYYTYKWTREDESDIYACRALLLNICFCIMFVFNDFMDSLFWMSSGITFGAACYSSQMRMCSSDVNTVFAKQ